MNGLGPGHGYSSTAAFNFLVSSQLRVRSLRRLSVDMGAADKYGDSETLFDAQLLTRLGFATGRTGTTPARLIHPPAPLRLRPLCRSDYQRGRQTGPLRRLTAVTLDRHATSPYTKYTSNARTHSRDLRLSPTYHATHQYNMHGAVVGGFLQLLAQLTSVGDVSKEHFMKRFSAMKACSGTYYVIVLEDLNTSEVIGAATLVVEQKFIHNCGARGRLEDVVVSDKYRGKQLGKLLTNRVSILAQELGCYKLTLECKDKLIPFYGSLGFTAEKGNSNFMTARFDDVS